MLDPHNPYVVQAHLPCAAQEPPLDRQTEKVFDLAAYQGAENLERRQLLRAATGEACMRAPARSPQKEVNIRGIGQSLSIFKKGRSGPSAVSMATGP